MSEEAAKKTMGLSDYMAALVLAIFTRHPFKNLGVVLGNLWEDFGPATWFLIESEPEPDPYIPVVTVQVQPGLIYYAKRWGVYVAYKSEDLADLEGHFMMVPPRLGMAIFAEHGSHVTQKTGNRRDLDELARLTGRRLELLPERALFIPFTSTSTDAELDLHNFGHFILTRDDALARWFNPTGQLEVVEG